MFKKLISRLLRKKQVDVGIDSTRYSAVEIESKLGKDCAAVQALHRKRFLSTQAPQIPVAGCNNKGCECRYVYHTERRDEPRRDEDFGLARYQPVENDRRHRSIGRRKDD